MNTNFDYVIVGAGSAGCVLANRLSENGKHSVVVIEAGGSDKRFWIQTPIGYGKIFYNSDVNWKYQAEPCPGINERTSYWPRGKVIGGSSSINAMVYVRGQHQDYDDWRDLGNDQWGWDQVLPYFKKSETNSNGGNQWRGDSGPLYVNDPSKNYHPLCQTFIEAAQQYGIPYNPDFNGETQEGAGTYQITTKNGFRMSAARAYLRPALKRKNCTLISHAHVTRICFDGQQATGIEYKQGNQIKSVKANIEVIVSAGAINSPQLLQLSGLGPAPLLGEHQVAILADLPHVGQNMQEHLGYTHYYRSKVPTLNNELSTWWGKLKVGAQYILTRKGILSLSVNQAGGFFRSSPQRTKPNLQMYFAAITYTSSPKGTRPLMRPDPWPGFLNGIGQLRPTSIGEVGIVSNDPFTYPRITPNYLSTEEDVQELLEGAKYIRAIAQTPALKEIIDSEMTPGINVASDEELIQDIRNRSDTIFHPTSTCRMGRSAADSVVDQRLRVHRVEKLRVVDASVFPTITSGNTNGPTIMVAEKAADFIIQDAR